MGFVHGWTRVVCRIPHLNQLQQCSSHVNQWTQTNQTQFNSCCPGSSGCLSSVTLCSLVGTRRDPFQPRLQVYNLFFYSKIKKRRKKISIAKLMAIKKRWEFFFKKKEKSPTHKPKCYNLFSMKKIKEMKIHLTKIFLFKCPCKRK